MAPKRTFSHFFNLVPGSAAPVSAPGHLRNVHLLTVCVVNGNGVRCATRYSGESSSEFVDAREPNHESHRGLSPDPVCGIQRRGRVMHRLLRPRRRTGSEPSSSCGTPTPGPAPHRRRPRRPARPWVPSSTHSPRNIPSRHLPPGCGTPIMSGLPVRVFQGRTGKPRHRMRTRAARHRGC
jgi:hypothetical protein